MDWIEVSKKMPLKPTPGKRMARGKMHRRNSDSIHGQDRQPGGISQESSLVILDLFDLGVFPVAMWAFIPRDCEISGEGKV